MGWSRSSGGEIIRGFALSLVVSTGCAAANVGRNHQISKSIHLVVNTLKMITKTSLTILMSLLSFCLFSQNNKISSIVKKIERSGGYFSKYVGYAGSPSEEYELYLKLKKRASIEDLTRLSYHNDPIVRSYVSLALSEKMTQDEFFPIVLDRLNDTASVTTMSGCIISTDIVGDIFVRNFYRKNNTYKKLDSLLFFGDYLIYSDDNIRYSGGYKKKQSREGRKETFRFS